MPVSHKSVLMPYFLFMTSKNSADFTGLPPPNRGHPTTPECYRTVILVTLQYFAPCNLFHGLGHSRSAPAATSAKVSLFRFDFFVR